MATLDNASAVFDFADQLALISSEVLRFRIKNKPRLTPTEREDLEKLEIELDQATARVRAAGIAALGTLTATARTEVQEATAQAEAFLKKVKAVEKAVGIATAVVGLALAITSGNAAAILKAARGVKSAAAPDPAAPAAKTAT